MLSETTADVVGIDLPDLALQGSTIAQLAPWVVLHEERCRGGRVLVLAVNQRDGHAIELDGVAADWCSREDGILPVAELAATDTGHALLSELWAGGFLTDRPIDLDRATPTKTIAERIASSLSTLDVHWSGADRFVRAAHRRGLRHIFHPAAVVAQLLLALVGVVALVAALRSSEPLELKAAAGHLPLLLALTIVAIGVHEFAHALVLVHYDRSVRSAGFRLHLGTPAFYIDSVDALLLTRHQRMLQVAAGPWAEWLVTSVVALTVWRSPLPLLVPVLHRFVVVNSMQIAANLMPFVGLDGSLLLADGTREPDLARRARAAAAGLMHSLSRSRRVTLEEGMLAGYAVLNTAFAALLLVVSGFFWYQLFGDLLVRVVAQGPLGWLIVVSIVGVLFRPSVMAFAPHFRAAASELRRGAERVRFRAQRRWRIQATLRLRGLHQLADLDEFALGVVAGGLERVRLVTGAVLRTDGFSGLVFLASGAIEATLDHLQQSVSAVPGSAWEVRDGLLLRCVRGAEVLLVPTSCIETARYHSISA